MNCRYAREIINIVLDGEGHPLEAQAREHLLECDCCRDWHASVQRAMAMLQASEAPPMPDIAAMVTRQLPASHPASRRGRINPRRALAWFIAAWIMGAVVVGGVAVAALPMIDVAGLGHAISLTKTMIRPLGEVVTAVKAGAVVIGREAVSIARAVGLGRALTIPLLIDLAIVAVVLLIRHRRHAISNACLI